MSYNRIGIPRAFVDLISYNLATGWSEPTNITSFRRGGSTAVSLVSGSGGIIELFDMKPSNHITIERENKEFYIQYDTEFATDALAESSFLAILNHNFYSSCVVFNVDISDDTTFPVYPTSDTDIECITGNNGSEFWFQSGLGLGWNSGFAGMKIKIKDPSDDDNDGWYTVDNISGDKLFVAETLNADTEIRDITFYNTTTRVTTEGNYTDVINAGVGTSTGEINPLQNGWTLMTFPTVTVNNKYLKITFTDDNGYSKDFEDDVKIGSILYGEIVDWTHSPELGVVTTYDYDGTNLHNSIGGSTYSTSTHLGQPDWAVVTPWTFNTAPDTSGYYFNQRAGRMSHSMKFKYLSDSDIFTYNQSSSTTNQFFDDDSSLHSQFYQRILGQHLPFLFTIDGTSGITGDYGLFRLDDSTFKSTQVAHRIWDIDLKITETW
jgi:hypothetical protein